MRKTSPSDSPSASLQLNSTLVITCEQPFKLYAACNHTAICEFEYYTKNNIRTTHTPSSTHTHPPHYCSSKTDVIILIGLHKSKLMSVLSARASFTSP